MKDRGMDFVWFEKGEEGGDGAEPSAKDSRGRKGRAQGVETRSC